MSRDRDQLVIRPARLSDADALWPIMCEPDVVHYSFEVGQVSRAVFEDWLKVYLNREDALFLIGEVGQRGIGYVRLDQEAGSIEIDIAVAKKERRKGYARALLKQGLAHLTQTWPEVHSVLAVVHFRNEASKTLFESEGFILKSMGTRQGVSVYRLTKML